MGTYIKGDMGYCTCYSAMVTGICTCNGSGFGGKMPVITCCTGLPDYETGEMIDCLASSRCPGCTSPIERFNDGIGIKDDFSYSKFVESRFIKFECKFCKLLEELYNSTLKSNRDYYVMTELFTIYHRGDKCNEKT